MQLTQKRIIITGGTSGIGYEVVRRLHKNNDVIVIARNATKLHQLTQKFKGITTYQADLALRQDVEDIANRLSKQFNTIDGIIHNAAVQYTPALTDEEFRYDTVDREIALNFTSICRLTYLLLPALRHDAPAFILNVGSGLGLVPKTGSAIYCATKGALNIFSQSLRLQLSKTNIRVLQAIMPLVDTPMTEGRGRGKMTAAEAARQLIRGIEKEIADHDIGKVKALRFIMRLWPGLARQIMKRR